MKPIKLTPQNAQAIVDCLKEANGRAHDHAYTSETELFYLAEHAEKELERLGLPKAMRTGATYHETSGDSVSNSYARKCFSRAATSVSLERRSTGWFLISAGRTDIYQKGGGEGRLRLTLAQSDEAVRRFRSQYSVVTP